jgi:hypothetical protein
MRQRIISVWIAIGSAASVALVCHLLAWLAGIIIQSRMDMDSELPHISKAFYPDALLIYFYPLPLGIWALLHTIRGRNDGDQSLLLITTTLGISIIFIVVFAFALALPFMPAIYNLGR